MTVAAWLQDRSRRILGLAEHGGVTTASYTPVGGSADTVTISAVRQSQLVDDAPDGEYLRRLLVCLVSTEEIATPTIGDSLTVFSITWRLERILATSPAGFHSLEWICYEPIKRNAPGLPLHGG